MKKNKEINLGYVIDRVMKANGWDQTALGKRIGAHQTMVSRMRKGEEWEQHWQILMKLRQLAVGLKIIDPKVLISMSDNVAPDNDAQHEPNDLKSKENSAEKGQPENAIYVNFDVNFDSSSLYLQ